MKKLLVLSAPAVLALVLVLPAAAGKPTRFVFSFDDPAYEALLAADLTAACGTPISVDADGKVIFIIKDKPTPRGVIEINTYEFHAVITNIATGATTSFVDAGPDLLEFDPKTGHLLLAITGRSTTGSGVIGRFVIDLDTGEVVAVSGLEVGDWIENTCEAIA